jgi:hypothetical protein
VRIAAPIVARRTSRAGASYTHGPDDASDFAVSRVGISQANPSGA